MKKRLDILVTERGLAESREKAKTLIMAGQVYVDGQKADKPGDTFSEDAAVEVRGKGLPYVSRGGLKLEKAMREFGLQLQGRTCMDIGASTGGFTDCMLQNGAQRVYSVDVGYGQLAWSLRTDPRVVNLERTNARYLTREQVPEEIDFFSVDVSFISLTLILPAVRPLLAEHGQAVCLIKPQFEAGREKVGKKGVVRDKAVHEEVIEKIRSFALENGFSVLGLTFSPVKGPEGNIEYLIYLERSEAPSQGEQVPSAQQVVEESHRALDR
ncbi:TlyA family RNA methyltransferase [Acutalibacter sp. LFL-21]|uniref:TlyA family RNA methyltransferase n=1 Tax=Acutalibacter sp. LFL-21 TaxID=2983399 RepID=UPI0015C009C7|nr:TlyA family RNA methyltransferase [Acutalibacter sp. LFL-21]MCU7653070.1 TlyA family RNA methyltransferase [Acutalibacter sp. LFL-21]